MPDWTDLLNRRPDLVRVEGDRRERMIRELADHLEEHGYDWLKEEAEAVPAGGA